MRRKILERFAIALFVILASGTAQAHKLKVFASATGPVIEGYAYFSPGGRAYQASVTVASEDGTVLDRLRTDNEGNFRFEAKRRIDYVVTVDGGDGHVASYTVSANDLPETLPVQEGDSPAAGAKTAAPAGPAVDQTVLTALIEQSVARQIRPLREELDANQEKIWWHDVLGGIGYIFGLCGLAFGLSSRRGRDAEAAKPALSATP